MIRAGWRATELYPFRLRIAIESSQVSSHPATPPPVTQPIDTQIPKKPRDIHECVIALSHENFAPRSTYLMLQNAAKAIALDNTTVAQLQAENQ